MARVHMYNVLQWCLQISIAGNELDLEFTDLQIIQVV